MPFPETREIEKAYDPKIVEILEAEGFTEVKSAKKRQFSPYDFRAFKDGKLCFIESRIRSPEAKTQFFTFRDTKLKHLAELEKKGKVYIILLNKFGHRILTLDALLSEEHEDVKFFKYKGSKAYYWVKEGWSSSRDGPLVKTGITIRKDQREWARKTHFNISSFVREKLDEKMRKVKFI